ncbi:hypothetical protein SAMN04487895_110208 [Paenibacillus sophorae]|uniref:SbsA Ig-like domain-containing protein n=1 Tax=Paenibacillus sophorae TaxID=1333845 RepID=A0A1H8S116_9BACL|nr:hypothetical protein [Paenibacillus sophorae]QWU16883.1 hypothetical protein KP014_06690 [Paenibacillus sophorae]SEO72381.1 hypothetical protein SAMN04487895_110208 [Paenibacillus sophorae]
MRYTLMKRYIVAVLLLMWMGLSVQPVYAGDGDGSGAGGGTSGAKPLKFVSATLVDEKTSIVDASDIPLKPKFRLLFDKNVVNSTVWGINRECFALSSDNGAVSIEVTKVDDTIDPSQRQAVFVEPVNALAPGVSYSLKVGPELVAKNGVSTLGGTTSGRGVTIAFTTKREERAQATDAPAKEEPVVAPSPKATSGPAGQKVQSGANPKTASASTAPGAASGQKTKAPAAGAAEVTGESKKAKSDQAPAASKPVGSGAAGNGIAASSAPAIKNSGSETAGSTAAASFPAQTARPAAQESQATASGTQAAATASASLQRPEATEAPAAVPAQPEDLPQPSAKAGTGETALAEPEAAAALSDTGSADPHWRLMMIVLVVLVAGWTAAEMLYFRRRRAGKRSSNQNDS